MSRHSPDDNSVTPLKAAVDVCRVCGDDFASKKGKHNLLQGKDLVRPDYTAALEYLTGPVLLGDGLPMAVCEFCRTQLKRYHRCAAEVDRIGSAVREKCNALSNMRRKRCASTTSILAPIQKQFKSLSPTKLSPIGTNGIDTLPAANPCSERVQNVPSQLLGHKEVTARFVSGKHTVTILPMLKQKLPEDGVVSARFQQTCSANVCTPAITHVVVRPGPMRSSKRAPTVADLILQKKKQQVEETKHMKELPGDGVVSATVGIPAITHVVVRPGPPQSSKRAPTVTDLMTQKKKRQVEEAKEMKVILKTASGMKSRVLRGPLEKIGQDLVQGRYKNLPRSIMAIPGLAYCVTNEVLKLVDRECRELTSKKFDSVLRRTTPSALADFTWGKVLREWEKTAPNFLRFLECASTVSTKGGVKGLHKMADGSKRYAVAMGGVILLRARSREMSAPLYHNAMVMHHGGVKKRCFRRLASLGICVSRRSTFHKLKQMTLSWDDRILDWRKGGREDVNVDDENYAGSLADGAGPTTDAVKDNVRV